MQLATAFVSCRCGELLPLFEPRCPGCGLPHPHVLPSELPIDSIEKDVRVDERGEPLEAARAPCWAPGGWGSLSGRTRRARAPLRSVCDDSPRAHPASRDVIELRSYYSPKAVRRV